jgi:hypothetical protein
MSNGDPDADDRRASNRDAWFTINQNHRTNTENHVAGLTRSKDCMALIFSLKMRFLYNHTIAGFYALPVLYAHAAAKALVKTITQSES